MFATVINPVTSPPDVHDSNLANAGFNLDFDSNDDDFNCLDAGASSIPNELLCHTFDSMSSKQLVCLRGVSPHFANVINYILRCRFLAIVQGGQYETLFESCTPSEKRYTHHKVLRLSHFEPSVSRAGSDAAFFSVPGNMPGYMPLDELEEFGTTLLALQVRTVVPPLPTPPATPSSSPDSSPPRSGDSRLSRPFTIPLDRFQYSLNVGSGHARLFRHQFEEPRQAVPSLNPNSSRTSGRVGPAKSATASRGITPHVLVPSGHTALLCAQIVCYREQSRPPGSRPDLGSGAGATSPDPILSTESTRRAPAFSLWPTPSPTTKVYEYYFEQIKVDVTKFVVAVEQGLDESLRSCHFIIPTVRSQQTAPQFA